MKVWERVASSGQIVYDIAERDRVLEIIVTRKIGEDYGASRLRTFADQLFVSKGLLQEWCAEDTGLVKSFITEAKRTGRLVETLDDIGVVVTLGAPIWISELEIRRKIEDRLDEFEFKPRRQLAEIVAEVVSENNESLHRFLRTKGLL